MNVNSTVTINQSLINKLTQEAIQALEMTAEAVHTEVVQAQVVPRDTGQLQNEAMFVDTTHSKDGSVSIVHSTPYARRLYFHPEYNFNQEGYTDNAGFHEGNANAKGKWFEDWMLGGESADFAAQTFAAIYKQLTGV